MKALSRKIPLFIVFFIGLIVLTGCPNPVNNPTGDPNSTTTTTVPEGISRKLRVNLDGAKALITKSSDAAARGMGKGFKPRAISDSPLVKIMEDGSLANVLDVDNGIILPDIDFIAISPQNDVFVYFKYSFMIDNLQIQFIKLKSDNTFEIVENSGVIQRFYYNGSSIQQKPIVFANDGSIFYAIWQDSGIVMKRYQDGISSALTDKIANTTIEAFFSDGENLYFVGRNNTDANKAYFLRMVKPDKTGKYVFYIDTPSNSWVRSVQKFGSDIFVHGWRIPDTVDNRITYNGLIKLVKDGDNFKSTLVVGYSNDPNAVNTGNKLHLKESVFTDRAVLDSIVKRFYTNGAVPSNIDYFKTISWDPNSTEVQTTFSNNQEKYFWYLLLKDTVGFDKTSYISAAKVGNLFGQSASETLLNDLMTTHYANYRIIASTDPMMKLDGTVDPVKFLAKFKQGNTRNTMFSSIAIKPGAVIPAYIPTYFGNSDKQLEMYAKKYFNTYFDYQVANKPENDTWASYYLTNQTNYYNIKGTTFDGYSNGKWASLDAFDKFIKNKITGDGANPTYVSTLFKAKKNPSNRRYDPNSDLLSWDELYSKIAWEWEEAAAGEEYPKSGVLGNYRIVSTNSSSKNFYGNFYTGMEKVHADISLAGPDGNVYDIFKSNVNSPFYFKDSVTILSETEFVETIRKRTNALENTFKLRKFGEDGLKTLYSQRFKGISNDERYRKVNYTSTGSVSSEMFAPLRIDVDYSSSWSESNFLSNYFEYETPLELPLNKYSDVEIESKSISFIKPEYATLDDLVEAIISNKNIASIDAKSNGTLKLDPAKSRITNEERANRIKWIFEETNPAKYGEYTKEGVLGLYKVTDTAWDEKNFIVNFFTNVQKKTYDFTTADGTNSDLRNMYNALMNDTVPITNVQSNLYSVDKGTTLWQWQEEYKNADGSIDETKVLNLVKRYSTDPSIKTLDPYGYPQMLYEVLTGTPPVIDNAETYKAILAKMFDLPGLPAYPTIMNSFWNYTENPESNSDIVNYQNLESFSVDSFGSIFGLFRKSWESSVYSIVQVMDAAGNRIRKILVSDLSSNGINLKDDALYFTTSTASGVWSLRRLSLANPALSQENLIPESENMELYRYTIAPNLGTVFFTGSNVTTRKLMVGTVNIVSKAIEYSETVGIGSTSEIEVFMGN